MLRRVRAHGRHSILVCSATALLSIGAVTACSSDSDSSSSSSKEYCEAIQRLDETTAPYATASTFPPEVATEVGEELLAALKAAPPPMQAALGRAILDDDTYARSDFDAYNESECNIDTSTIRARPG